MGFFTNNTLEIMYITFTLPYIIRGVKMIKAKLRILASCFIEYIDRTRSIYKYYSKSNKWSNKNNKLVANYYSNKIYNKFKCIISPKSSIKETINFPHPLGIVIGEGVIMKDNVTIYQNVTIGRKHKNIPEYPIIEEDVIIYANSVICGDIVLKKGTIIGANSVVLKDTEENGIYIGNPAKKIGVRNINEE